MTKHKKKIKNILYNLSSQVILENTKTKSKIN